MTARHTKLRPWEGTVALLVVIVPLMAFIAPDLPASLAEPRTVRSLAFESLGDFGGSYSGVVVEGHFAFASRGLRLEVLDVTDPASPMDVGLSDALPALAAIEAVGDGRAYLVERVRTGDIQDQYDVLHIVDVTDPAAPRLRGSLRAAKGTFGVVAAHGDVAYCAAGKTTLTIVDVADAGKPVLLAAVELGTHVNDLGMYGGHLLAAVSGGAAGNGLLVLDTADPAAPRIAGRLEAGSGGHIEVFGQNAMLEGGGRLTSIDLADPTSPRVLGVLDVQGDHTYEGISSLAVTGQRAFALETPHAVRDMWHLHLVDVSDPATMKLLGEESEWGGPIVAAGAMVLKADGAIGLRTLAEAPPGTGTLFAEPHRVPTIGQPMGVAIADDRAYVADADTELWVLDVSDPTAPIVVGRTWFVAPHLAELHRASSGAISYRDGYVYAERLPFHFQVGGLHIFDVRDPANPRQVGLWDPWLEARDNPEFPEMWDLQPAAQPVLDGNRAWVSGYPWLVGLDVSDPATPHYLARFDPPPGESLDGWNVAGADVKGRTAWLAALDGGIVAVSLSEPLHPALAAHVDAPGYVRDVAEHGGYLLAGLGSAGLRVLDATTLEAVRELHDAPTYRITVSKDTAFAGSYESGLVAVDVADPALPLVQGT